MSKHNHAAQWLKYAEDNRREKSGGFTTLPIAQGHINGAFVDGAVIDYAEPLAHLKHAVAHLDEGLPGTQLERTLAAYHGAKAALGELEVWLRLNGVLAGHATTEH